MLTDPDRNSWDDSVSISEKGFFEYAFTAAQADCHIVRVAVIPKGSGPNTFLEGKKENSICLIVPDTGWIEIEASSDELFFSCRILNGPDHQGLEALRDLKLPFLHFLEVNEDDAGCSTSEAPNESQRIELDMIIEQYQKDIVRFLERPCSNGLMLIGLYDHYISSRGRADPAVFRPFLQRITDTSIPLYKQLGEQYSYAFGLQGKLDFPDPPLLDTSGRQQRLSSLRADYLVIDFWASWCGPCRQVNRDKLPALQQQFDDCGVVVVGLSLDKQEQSWLKALASDRPYWPQFREKETSCSFSDVWGIYSIPYYVVLDREYRAVYSSSLIQGVSSFLKNACDY